MSNSSNTSGLIRDVGPQQHIGPSDPVRLIMKDSLALVNSDDNLLQAADELARNEIGVALVGHDGTDGLISERDIVAQLSLRADVRDTQVGDVRTCDLVWATPTTSIFDVGTLMLQANVRHIPVREGGMAVGMVSIRDVLAVFLSSIRPGWSTAGP